MKTSMISCTSCDVFGHGSVTLRGHKAARLVQCGACHRVWFRPKPKSFRWEEVVEEGRAINLKREFGWVNF